MSSVNYLAVIVCALVAFVASTAWYIVFSKTRNLLTGLDPQDVKRPPPAKILLELLRTIIVALVFARVLTWSQRPGLGNALQLAALFWLAFPAVLLSGSVMWDKVPTKLAMIHAGDWFIKLALIAVIIGIWR